MTEAEVTTLARGECLLCGEPFAYRAPGPRNVCDNCIDFMIKAVN